MKQYIGKYRVACSFDLISGKPNKEDLFIVCTNGGQIYPSRARRYVYYHPKSRYSIPVALEKAGIKFETWLEDETEIFFDPKDLDSVAKIVGALTKGAEIPPHSVRNRRFSK